MPTELFYNENFRMRQLQHFSKQGRNKEVIWLLDVAKVPVDAKDLKDLFHAHDPSQMAATEGKVSTLKILRLHGADLFSYTRTGMTHEELSDKHRHARCSRWIRKAKEDIEIAELMEEYGD